MVVPIAPELTPMPKKERVVQLNMNEETQFTLQTIAVVLGLLLLFGAMFWMFSANSHNHSLRQRVHDEQCGKIHDDALKRDCLSGVSLVEHPEYAK